MTSDLSELGVTELRRILVEDIGLAPRDLTADSPTALDELGLDSIAQVELEVVLRRQFGLPPLPDTLGSLSLAELAALVGELRAGRK